MTDVKTALQAANWDLGAQNGAMEESATRQNRLPTSCHWRRQLLPGSTGQRRLRIPVPNACLPTVLATLIVLHYHADAAVAELRKKGLAAANKKASRHAAEGLVGLAKGDGVAAVVEVRTVACEAPSAEHPGRGRCCQAQCALGGRRGCSCDMRAGTGTAMQLSGLPQAAIPTNSTPRQFRNEAEPASLGHPSRRQGITVLFSDFYCIANFSSHRSWHFSPAGQQRDRLCGSQRAVPIPGRLRGGSSPGRDSAALWQQQRACPGRSGCGSHARWQRQVGAHIAGDGCRMLDQCTCVGLPA